MFFLEIAFQAEVNRFEDPEFEELARINCCEDPKTRTQLIEELRSLILERGECNPRRLDDAYLLKFLRCRRFVPALAHKLMVRYEEFRRDHAYLYDCDPFSLHKVKNVFAGLLPESPNNGRIILMRFGRWDTDSVSKTDLVRAALIMNEITLQQPKMQVLGFTVIADLENLSLGHVRRLNATVANQMVSLFGVAYPLILHRIHIINYSTLHYTLFFLIKQFLPTSLWNRIQFHSDLKSLQEVTDPEYLPPEYGGTCRCVVKFEDWIKKIDLYKDEYLVRELKDLGFTVNEKD